VLADVANAGQLQVTRDAAVKLALELVVHEFKTAPYDFSAAFATFARGKAEAMVSLGSSFFVPGRRLIPELALKHKLPSVFTNNLWADSGGLMSYGPDFSAAFRRAAEQVVQLLGGARPGDMPIEQPNIIEMVINLKTAKALGVVVPQALRLRADRIIE
jgi:putative ABC transport system substrate-binding protein